MKFHECISVPVPVAGCLPVFLGAGVAVMLQVAAGRAELAEVLALMQRRR